MDRKRTIVYIDSEPKYQTRLRQSAKRCPYRFIACRRGEEGLNSIAEEQPDVVIVDSRLADGTGEEVYTRYLMESRFRNLKGIPFIVLTHNGSANRSRLYSLGFSGCLQKPFRSSNLIEFIEDVLVSHQLKMEEVSCWETIRQARDFLEKVVESSADAIVTTDNRGIVTYCNHACEEMFGYPFEELVGQSVSRYFEGGNTELLKISAILMKRSKVQNYKSEVLKKDGTRISVNFSISGMKTSDGKMMGALGIAKEMAGDNFTEYDVNESDKVAAVVETAVAVNHAINNPLVPILGNAQFLLQDERVKDDDIRKRLRIIVKNALRIRDITQKLANITHPVTKEYLRGTRMLDIDAST